MRRRARPLSVRSSILATLTLGPAYGLQVHAEIEARTARVGEINVGQIYSTLARLKTAGLVTVRSTTPDGLPLYELTPDGRGEAERWLSSVQPAPAPVPSWNDMVDHLLLAASLPGADVARLVDHYRAAWLVASVAVPNRSTASIARADAEASLAAAAQGWLEHFARTPFVQLGYSADRPKRGRRPTPSARFEPRAVSAGI